MITWSHLIRQPTCSGLGCRRSYRISPYSRPHFIDRTVYDFRSVLTFIENEFRFLHLASSEIDM